MPEPVPSKRARARQQLIRLPSPHLDRVAARLKEVAPSVRFFQAEQIQNAYYRDPRDPRRALLSVQNVDSEMLATVARGTLPLSVGWARAWNRAWATRSVERRMAPLYDAVLCVSDQDASVFEQYCDRVIVAPNGVDDELLAIPERGSDSDLVLFFGQLDYAPNQNGIRRFLDHGWPSVRAARPHARLRIIGRGASADLERAAARPGVELVGPVSDIVAELASCRLTLVPIWQGGGTRLKVLESLAAARPVIGTGLGVEGLGFRDRRHGLVEESPADLGRAIGSLLSDEPRLAAYGAAGRALAKRYRWATVTEPAECLYAEWLSQVV